MRAWALTAGLVVACGSLHVAAADLPKQTKAELPPHAKAELLDAKGKSVGQATLTETPNGVLISISVHDLPPGPHGFHIHDKGDCHGPDFKSAGGHFNPGGKGHGYLNAKGPHAGDLPNLVVSDQGTVSADVLAAGVTLKAGPNSLLKAGGTSLMIHAKGDDYKSDPAGNSGDRIACGAIKKVE